MRGYYGIALFEPKTEENLGTIIRSAHDFGVDFICTIGNRYYHQRSDTTKGTKHIPLFHFEDTEDFLKHIPEDCELVSVEVNGKKSLPEFKHQERAIYVFGGEDRTIPEDIQSLGRTVKIDTKYCLNLAVTASIVMYDRGAKTK